MSEAVCLAQGLEAPIALHVMNNILAMGICAFFAGGGGIGQERGTGSAAPYMLLFLLAEAVAVLIIWRIKHRRARTGHGEHQAFRANPR